MHTQYARCVRVQKYRMWDIFCLQLSKMSDHWGGGGGGGEGGGGS